MPPCRRHWHRHGPSLDLGQDGASRRRCMRGFRGCVLFVEGNCMNHARKSRAPLYAFVAFAFAMCVVPAQAHLNSTGMGPLYDGLMHFLLSPEDFVPVLALALLAGLRGASHGRRALFTLPAAWFLGGLLGLS